jgi:hypothetical protein
VFTARYELGLKSDRYSFVLQKVKKILSLSSNHCAVVRQTELQTGSLNKHQTNKQTNAVYQFFSVFPNV